MSDQLKPKLAWFLKNLDLLIEDLQCPIELYFDAYDVVRTILGFHNFVTKGPNIASIFDTDSQKPLKDHVLIHCLAMGGFLGEIKMFPPHQAELLRWFEKNLDIDSGDDSQKLAKFVNNFKRLEALRNGSRQTARDHLEDARDAVRYFKLIQLVSGLTWRNRYRLMKSKGLLRLSAAELHPNQLLRSDRFRQLVKVFTTRRPHYDPENNFNDAVALTLLADGLDAHRKNQQSPVPCLFVSSVDGLTSQPLFLDVIKEAEIERDFEYDGLNGSPIKVLREADYFCFKAVFGPFMKKSEQGKWLFVLEDLKQLAEQVRSIVDSPEGLQKEINVKVHNSQHRLTDLLDDLNRFLFFRNVWMTSADESQGLGFDDLSKTLEKLTAETLEEEVNDELDRDKDNLKQGLEQYYELVSLWKPFQTANQRLRKITSSQISFEADHFRDFGLLRFGFPDRARGKIEKALRELLHGKEPDAESVQYRAIAACHPASAYKQKDDSELMVAAAILWVADQFEQLSKLPLLLVHFERRHYSLRLICAAASQKLGRHEQKVAQVLQQLQDQFKRSGDRRIKADIANGIAYLYFQQWENTWTCAWDRPSSSDSPESDSNSENFIDKVVDWVDQGYRRLEDRKEKQVYALNQKLYYLVKGAGNQRLGEMARLAKELSYFLGKPEWEHRFDDTLAHYYHRLAVLAADREDWHQAHDLIKVALSASEDACKPAAWDQPTQDYRKRLKLLEVNYAEMVRKTKPH